MRADDSTATAAATATATAGTRRPRISQIVPNSEQRSMGQKIRSGRLSIPRVDGGRRAVTAGTGTSSGTAARMAMHYDAHRQAIALGWRPVLVAAGHMSKPNSGRRLHIPVPACRPQVRENGTTCTTRLAYAGSCSMYDSGRRAVRISLMPTSRFAPCRSPDSADVDQG